MDGELPFLKTLSREVDFLLEPGSSSFFWNSSENFLRIGRPGRELLRGRGSRSSRKNSEMEMDAASGSLGRLEGATRLEGFQTAS